MSKLYDKDGKEVEAFTQEELDAKVQAEKETAIAEANAQREEEITNLYQEKEEIEQEKATLETKLAGLEDKDKNFTKLREKADEKDKKISELETKITQLEAGFQKEIGEIKTTKIEDVKKERISILSRGDQELAKKIDFHYKSFAGEAKTKEEIEARVNSAYILATGGKRIQEAVKSNSSAGGDVPTPKDTQDLGKLSDPQVKDVAHKLGITDKELAQHGLI